ncbi:MAG: cytochrome c [Myxococcaceae bacterium]
MGAALVVVAGCTAKYVRPTTEAKVALTEERIKRGQYLVNAVGACGACHDGRDNGELDMPANPDLHLAGGNMMRDMGLAIWIPNITNDPETGLGSWTDDEIIRSIRDGVGKDGKFLFPIMPFAAYQNMSDEDVRSVVAYIRSLPPVKQTRPRQENEIPFMAKAAIGMGAAMHDPVTSVPEPDRNDPVKHGEYLAYVAHCTECHSLGSMGTRGKTDRWLAGSDSPMDLPGVGKVWASNLTPDKETGVGKYSAEQIKTALRSGMRLDGKRMAPPMSLFMPHIAQWEEADLDAVVAYLQSLPPVVNKVPARELTPQFAGMIGE